MSTTFKLKLERYNTSSTLLIVREDINKSIGYAIPGADGYYSFAVGTDHTSVWVGELWSEEALKEIVRVIHDLNTQWEEKLNSL